MQDFINGLASALSKQLLQQNQPQSMSTSGQYAGLGQTPPPGLASSGLRPLISVPSIPPPGAPSNGPQIPTDDNKPPELPIPGDKGPQTQKKPPPGQQGKQGQGQQPPSASQGPGSANATSGTGPTNGSQSYDELRQSGTGLSGGPSSGPEAGGTPGNVDGMQYNPSTGQYEPMAGTGAQSGNTGIDSGYGDSTGASSSGGGDQYMPMGYA